MSYVSGTGAFWLDVILMGFSFTLSLMLTYAVVLAHPGIALDSGWVAISDAFYVFGAWLMVLGVWVGRRTRWALIDPKRAKTR